MFLIGWNETILVYEEVVNSLRSWYSPSPKFQLLDFPQELLEASEVNVKTPALFDPVATLYNEVKNWLSFGKTPALCDGW